MHVWQQSTRDVLDDPQFLAVNAAGDPSARTRLARPRQAPVEHRAIWKGAVAGLAGGLAASWTMNQFQSQLSKWSSSASSPPARDDEDATMKAASAIAQSFGDHALSKREKEVGGSVLHYAFGTAMGAVYGALTEASPHSAAGWGLPFGALLWLGADEIAVSRLGLSGSPTEAPASVHASALAAHLVYGFTADTVRRGVRAAL